MIMYYKKFLCKECNSTGRIFLCGSVKFCDKCNGKGYILKRAKFSENNDQEEVVWG